MTLPLLSGKERACSSLGPPGLEREEIEKAGLGRRVPTPALLPDMSTVTLWAVSPSQPTGLVTLNLVGTGNYREPRRGPGGAPSLQEACHSGVSIRPRKETREESKASPVVLTWKHRQTGLWEPEGSRGDPADAGGETLRAERQTAEGAEMGKRLRRTKKRGNLLHGDARPGGHDAKMLDQKQPHR